MAGTIAGGKAAAKTNIERYGAGFYSEIGAKGGRNGRDGGFSKNIVCTKETCKYELDPHYIKQCAGSRGGQASRRGKAKA